MIIKLLVLTGIILSIASNLSGKEKTQAFYPASAIDSSLRRDAWAVCREYRQEFELLSYGKAVERVHIVVTVLDKNGDNFGELILPYDKSSKITSLTGNSYNALGQRDDRLKNNAITHQSGIIMVNLFEFSPAIG